MILHSVLSGIVIQNLVDIKIGEIVRREVRGLYLCLLNSSVMANSNIDSLNKEYIKFLVNGVMRRSSWFNTYCLHSTRRGFLVCCY